MDQDGSNLFIIIFDQFVTSLKIQDGWENKNNFSYHWVIFASLCARITENVQCTFLHLCSTCWRMESSILFFVINFSKLRSFAFLSVFSKIPIMKNKAIDRMAASCYSGFIFWNFSKKMELSKSIQDIDRCSWKEHELFYLRFPNKPRSPLW